MLGRPVGHRRRRRASPARSTRRRFTFLYHRDGRLTGVLGLARRRATSCACRALVDEGAPDRRGRSRCSSEPRPSARSGAVLDVERRDLEAVDARGCGQVRRPERRRGGSAKRRASSGEPHTSMARAPWSSIPRMRTRRPATGASPPAVADSNAALGRGAVPLELDDGAVRHGVPPLAARRRLAARREVNHSTIARWCRRVATPPQ